MVVNHLIPPSHIRIEVTTAERDHTMQQTKRRSVQYKYTPISTMSLFRSRSIAHQAIVVGDHRSHAAVVIVEMLKFGNEISYDITRPPTATVVATNRIIGYTERSDEEIEQHGEEIPLPTLGSCDQQYILQPMN